MSNTFSGESLGMGGTRPLGLASLFPATEAVGLSGLGDAERGDSATPGLGNAPLVADGAAFITAPDGDGAGPHGLASPSAANGADQSWSASPAAAAPPAPAESSSAGTAASAAAALFVAPTATATAAPASDPAPAPSLTGATATASGTTASGTTSSTSGSTTTTTKSGSTALPAWMSTLANSSIATDMAAADVGGTVTYAGLENLVADLDNSLTSGKTTLSASQFSDLKIIAANLNNGVTTSSY